ncbi:MAG: rod shape-determining protein [Patescibacteria group bacterium]
MIRYIVPKIKQVQRLFDTSLGLDLGTSFLRVWQSSGVIQSFPHILAVDRNQQKVIAFGQEAKEMVGKVPEHIAILQPFQRGVISLFTVSKSLYQYLFHRFLGKFFLFKPLIMASVASDATPIERQAVSEALFAAGARQVYLIDSPLAAAIGAGIPVAQSNGNIVVHIGAGMTEIAVISLGSIVMMKSIRMGGNDFDRVIAHQIRKNYGVSISLDTAQYIKENLLDLRRSQLKKTIQIKAKDLVTGHPKELLVEADKVLSSLEKPLKSITQALQEFLEEIPAELASDVIDKGVILTGGGAKLLGFDFCLTQVIGVPVSLSEHAELCVIHGIELALQHLDLYKQSLAFESMG